MSLSLAIPQQLILCVKHRGQNWRNVTHEACVPGTNAPRPQRTVQNLPSAIILAKLFRMVLLEKKKSHYAPNLCAYFQSVLSQMFTAGVLFGAFSRPSESQSTSREFLLTIPDHYDSRLYQSYATLLITDSFGLKWSWRMQNLKPAFCAALIPGTLVPPVVKTDRDFLLQMHC